MNVLVVESPSKAKSINKYLGDDYKVLASIGHVRDLSTKNDAIDTDNNFEMKWETSDRGKKVIKEIRKDFNSGKQMNRLLQGDVGSGKTIVSLMIILIAIDNGYQSCILAPTEILAQQHFNSISKLLEKLNVNAELLTGSTPTKSRKNMHQKLLNNEIQILIGTHAILEDLVKFKNLGLAIIDEQHRFGVAQRAKLWKKNASPPHILVMTATPIPRTLAMSVYGDLDISIINKDQDSNKNEFLFTVLFICYRFSTNLFHRFNLISSSLFNFAEDNSCFICSICLALRIPFS